MKRVAKSCLLALALLIVLVGAPACGSDEIRSGAIGEGPSARAPKTATSETDRPTADATASAIQPVDPVDEPDEPNDPGITSLSQLQNAPVPASCDHAPARFKGGKLNYGKSPEGSDRGFAELRVDTVSFGDVTGDGVSEGTLAMVCSAGGVSWPNVVLVYGSGPELLATYDFGDFEVSTEHADVTKLEVRTNGITVDWNTYEGCCFQHTTWTGELSLAGDQLTLDDAKPGLVRYDMSDGVRAVVTPRTDIDLELATAPPEFREFVADHLAELGPWEGECVPTIEVDRVSYKGFASGSFLECGGAAELWGVQNGRWKVLFGTQDGWMCADLKKVNFPAEVLRQPRCYNEDYKDIPYRN